MRKLLLLIMCLMTISGCGTAMGSSSSSSMKTALNLPPSVEIVVNEIEYPTRQGSYCWRNGNSAQCVDMSSPTELLTEEDVVTVSPGETITLLIGRAPIEQELSIENVESNVSQSVELIENKFSAPMEKGRYIYLHFARWDDNGTGTGGDSSNAFMIEVE
ncbi:hypothetical protein UACE39S_00150 [Ureibacillus acetophenoni]